MNNKTTEDLLAFMSVADGGFGNPENALDHPLKHIENPDCSVTETWWWSFHIPERKLTCEIYFWIHSNLKTMSGGVWVFEGIKKHHLQCEHFNWLHFLPAPEIGENTLYCPQLDLRINILEPLQKHEVTYNNPESDTRIHIIAESVQPPILRSNNAHYEQVQRITGTLRLNGEDLSIDSMTFRDRSWGEPRPEAAIKHPPTLWGVGVSADGKRSFNFNACDDPERNPLVAEYGLTKESAFKIGWIYDNGDLRKLVSMSKLTKRAEDGVQAVTYDAEFTDDRGKTYKLTGEILSACPWSVWPNMLAYFGQLCRWTLDGEVMYGEAQEVFWADCYRKMLK